MKEDVRKIKEEIGQDKLSRIHLTEAKIREYKSIFSEIKEDFVIVFTKNISSNIFVIIFSLAAGISLLLWGLLYFFPEEIVKWSDCAVDEEKDLFQILKFLSYFFISIAILFRFISSLLKKNIRKRNAIYDLSELLKEVIGYMEESVKEDKMKYEYFIDNLISTARNTKQDETKQDDVEL